MSMTITIYLTQTARIGISAFEMRDTNILCFNLIFNS